METNNYSSQPNDFDAELKKSIQSAMREKGRFIYQCMEIKYTSVNVGISEVKPIFNNEEYNCRFCGTAKFDFLKKGEEGVIDNTHYTFEGYACAEKTQIISLSDIICTKKISF